MMMNAAREPGARASWPMRGASPDSVDGCLTRMGVNHGLHDLRHGARSRGFTLIELLVVILIILIVSAVALPTVLPALSHRQVSEAARILQGALVGARDSAIKNNAPSGLRLLPDPAFPVQYTTINGLIQIDPTLPLAANRIVPIAPAPDYSEGLVIPFNGGALPVGFTLPYPCLVLKESVLDPNSGLANEPTSWFWNVRVGDKVQINESGPWYTVVGPMTIPPQGATINNVFYANNELFVNDGPPGKTSSWQELQGNPAQAVNPEYLYLVDGQDDNGNGWIDEGFDGVDNNLAYELANNLPQLTDDILEWEQEAWQGPIASNHIVEANVPYTIQRRPAPASNAREVLLPTNVVIDLTTWGYPTLASPSQERSRLPVNQYTGYVDILVYPNGTVVPTTIYSTPSSFGMSASFFHFWLAERSDVFAPMPNTVNAKAAPYLPLPPLGQNFDSLGIIPALFNGAEIKGEYRLVTLFTRTGQITTNEEVPFDTTSNINGGTFNTSVPFLQAQQGVRGGN